MKELEYTIEESLTILADVIDEIEKTTQGRSKISIQAKLNTVIQMFQIMHLKLQEREAAKGNKS